MKIGIPYYIHPFPFHSSRYDQGLALAAVMRELGHDVILLNQDASQPGNMKEFIEKGDILDLFIDIDGICLPEIRATVAKRVVVLFRGNPAFTYLEKSAYIQTSTEYTLGQVHEVWVWDVFVAQSQIPLLQSLFEGLPVRRVPYVWIGHSESTSKNVIASPKTLHIIEKNTTNTSSSIVPFIAATKHKHATKIRVFNGKRLVDDKFFQKNIRDNLITDATITYEDRESFDLWSDDCIVIGHVRFIPFRPVYLDLVWRNIPLIHNCPILKECPGMESLYYSESEVDDIVERLGSFSNDAWNSTASERKAWLEAKWSVEKQVPAWSSILDHGLQRQDQISLIKAKEPVEKDQTVIAFSDMWEGFDPTNNFFLDLMDEQGVIGVLFDPTSNASPNLLICGPFGNTWTKADSWIPKVYFSGERLREGEIADPRINLYLTHDLVEDDRHIRFPIWLLFLHWFGTPSNAATRNPIGMSVDLATIAGSDERTHFCSFVVSNPTNPERNAAFEALNGYKPVRSGGNFRNNIGGPLTHLYGGGGGGDVAKHTFLKEHVFNLCYENGLGPGYVTEKLLHAKMAGCVPLYWGSDTAAIDFDPSGFVQIGPGTDLVAVVKDLEAHPEKIAALQERPALDPVRLATAQATLQKTRQALRTLVRQGSLEPDLYVTSFATLKYLDSLKQCIQGLAMLRHKLKKVIGFIAFIGSDVGEEHRSSLLKQFPWIQVRSVPDRSPVPGFPDFLEPSQFGWKLWLLKELCHDRSLSQKQILYTDCATVWLSLPEEMLSVAKKEGVCLMTDQEQINRTWCSEEMVQTMNVTEAELDQHQLVAGFIAFTVAAGTAKSLFDEAYEWGSKRECLFGPNFVGSLTKIWGHRHDQSILSILKIRHRISTVDKERLVCTESMRKTHQKNACVYLHRNSFTVHRPIFPGIDDIWMVSLDRRSDRYSSWKAVYPELPVNRLPAIDGKMLELSQNLFTLFEKNDFQWKKSVAGCALSHILLWAQLASEQSFVKNYLILEDDQRFVRPGWKAELALALASAPSDAELLYLGGVLPGNMSNYSSSLEPVNDVWATIRPNNMFTADGSLVPVFHFCTYAYVLTRQGAQKLLKNIGDGGCRTSIDHYLGHPFHGLKKYVMRDLMATCFQDSDPAYKASEFDNFQRVDTFDSDIWNNKDCFTEVDTFHKSQDVSLWDCIADVLVQAPHSIQTRNTLQRSALTFSNTVKGPIVYYFDRKDGKPHDGTLEERWIRSLWPNFVFKPLRSNEPFVSGAWILMARPNMGFWLQVAEQLNRGKVPFQILHLSDEFGKDPVQMYKLPMCRRVVRNYARADVTDEKVATIPLGFAHGYGEGVSEKQWSERTFVWSFHGTNWFGRGTDLKPLERLIPHSLKLQHNFLDKDMTSPAEYRDLLKGSQFVPVPRGNSPETYRLYEALENGCIPLYVRSEGDELFWNWIRGKLPLQEFRSWTDAYTQCHLWTTTEETAAEMYLAELLNAWALWKTECKNAFVV